MQKVIGSSPICSTTPFQTTRQVHRLVGLFCLRPQPPQTTRFAAFFMPVSAPPTETRLLAGNRPLRRPPPPKVSAPVVISPRVICDIWLGHSKPPITHLYCGFSGFQEGRICLQIAVLRRPPWSVMFEIPAILAYNR